MKKIIKCRVCGSNKLVSVGGLGNIAISTFTDKPSDGKKWPLNLTQCQSCFLIQLWNTPPKSLMFRKFYWYKSGINKVIVNALRDIALTAIKISKIKPGEIFLDIGANDGTLLSFVPKEYKRYGVEPAENFRKELKKVCYKYMPDFWSYKESDGYKAKVITAIGMFY